jgi:DNA-binding LacI/PurR family transcriptional regulator
MAKVSQADIARDLGISQMTVSKAIRGAPRISEELREKVLRRAREMGYRPNRLARSLQGGRTRMVGFLAPTFSGRFFSGLLRAIQQGLAAADYHVLLWQQEAGVSVDDRPVRAFQEYQVDGIIACARHTVPWEESIYARAELQEPVVYVDNRAELPEAHNVYSDDADGMRQVIEHLVERGHRRIGFLYPDSQSGTVYSRLAGFRAVMAGQGLDPVTCACTETESDHLLTGRLEAFLTADHPDLTALTCHNDPLAMRVLGFLKEVGLSVPGDLSLVGYGDDLRYADQMRVPLTTVDQHPDRLGRRAAEALLDLLEEEDVPHDQAEPVSLVARESVAEV